MTGTSLDRRGISSDDRAPIAAAWPPVSIEAGSTVAPDVEARWPSPAGDPPAAMDHRISLDPGLAAALGPLRDLLYLPLGDGHYAPPDDVVEISINEPHVVFVEHAGKGYAPAALPRADRIWAEDLFQALANLGERDGRLPTLSASLPGGHRIQMVVGESSVARTGMALSVRIMRHKHYDWGDYGIGDAPPAERHGRDNRGRPGASQDLARRYDSGYAVGSRRDLVVVLERGWPILLVGETNSGKTSFLRMLMQRMTPERRVITIEDEAELWRTHANQVGLIVANPVHYGLYVKAILRMNPGAVIGGEIQPDNAFALFRLLIAGHRNFLTTIHGGSAREGFEAWVANITLNAALGPQAAASVRSPLAQAIARIVHLGPDRRVTEVLRPADDLDAERC